MTAALTPYEIALAVPLAGLWLLLIYAAVKSLPLARACRDASADLAGEER